MNHNKHDNLMSKVFERANLKEALERVRANKGAPGTDGMSVNELLPFLSKHWPTIKMQLETGAYKPTPVKRVSIPKPNGGLRNLGIPTVLDRFIQQAILQVLVPIFDPHFSEHSYGFRPKRSARQAVMQAKSYVQQGYKIVVDTDLEKFFDTVNHDMLMEKLHNRIADKILLKLIRKYLQAGVMINGCCVITEEGTPQGGPLSPLLSNIVLDDLDKELMKRGHKFARYADDCNIYTKTKRAGERVFASITNFIEKKLNLKVNKEKSATDYASRRKILGFRICGKMLILAQQTIKRLKDKIRDLTKRGQHISIANYIKRLNEYLVGWLGYYWIANMKEMMQSTEQWIRRRLRAIILKQWKLPRTKLRELRARGISDEAAKKIAYSRKKEWRLANTPQINVIFGIAYWERQGLIKLQETYSAKWNRKIV
jgi:RNA-directed DNA polymerase